MDELPKHCKVSKQAYKYILCDSIYDKSLEKAKTETILALSVLSGPSSEDEGAKMDSSDLKSLGMMEIISKNRMVSMVAPLPKFNEKYYTHRNDNHGHVSYPVIKLLKTIFYIHSWKVVKYFGTSTEKEKCMTTRFYKSLETLTVCIIILEQTLFFVYFYEFPMSYFKMQIRTFGLIICGKEKHII